MEFSGRVMFVAQKDIESALMHMHEINWSLTAPSLLEKWIRELEPHEGKINLEQYRQHLPAYKEVYLKRLENKIEGIYYMQEKYPDNECENVCELKRLVDHAEKEGVDGAKIALMREKFPRYEKTKLLRRAERDAREWPERSTLTGEYLSVEDVHDRIGEANRSDLDAAERKWLMEIHVSFLKKRAEHMLSSPGAYSSSDISDMIRTLKLQNLDTKAMEDLLDLKNEVSRIWERTKSVRSDIGNLEVSLGWHLKETRGLSEWLAEDAKELPGIKRKLQKLSKENIDITDLEKRVAEIERKINGAGCGIVLT
jgi:hypothetical protein